MATTVILHLSGGNNFRKIVRFTGLSHDMLLHPAVTSEPVLTAQAFYYIDDLELVAKIRFEHETDEISEADIDYLVDNYLFELSRIHDEQKICAKLDRFRFWSNDPDDFYVNVDNRHTRSLVLDVYNDPDVAYVLAADGFVDVNLSSWDIGRNCAADCLQAYVKTLAATLESKISTAISPTPYRSGYIGRMRVLKSGDGLLDFNQAMSLEDISIRAVGPETTVLPLRPSDTEWTETDLSVEHVQAINRYNPVLLSHYFSGLKEINPMKAFIGFYNVLEYFLGEIPAQTNLGRDIEKVQLAALIKHLFTEQNIQTLILKSTSEDLSIVSRDLMTSSGVPIRGLILGTDTCAEVSRWLYDIRCAVVHSKKSRRGQLTASFEPYSAASNSLQSVVPIVRWIAAEAMMAEGVEP
ncbi:hypothetical protein [Rhizobium sp. FY34]|uniref:hypothetical protein n=1 Tax=Rhizobium sp. FY34 TaxID=2562309 RepID=UPI0010C01A19|nr:hypothetical protein [Rhizobium sp. FY34]